ncbi:MAG: hypothetical protein IPL08_13310 [Saprospiraceae bacterium]|nr:hypothetical protein [Saprospiraceae bacterium]
MYRLLHTTTLLLLSLWVSGQNNHYFIDHARWVYQTEESYEPGQIFMYSGVEENTILGDTILDGALYKKLYKDSFIIIAQNHHFLIKVQPQLLMKREGQLLSDMIHQKTSFLQRKC